VHAWVGGCVGGFGDCKQGPINCARAQSSLRARNRRWFVSYRGWDVAVEACVAFEVESQGFAERGQARRQTPRQTVVAHLTRAGYGVVGNMSAQRSAPQWQEGAQV
jgi:hypothetical protein